MAGPENVTDVAFDTEGFAHPWCDDDARAPRKKAALYPPAAPSTAAAQLGTRERRARFSLNGRHPDSAVSREGVEARVEAREFGGVVFGSASRTTALLPLVRTRYPTGRVALVYGEDLPVPLGAGLPLEGIQRPVGSTAPLPSLAEASQWGMVFQREIYDGPTVPGAPAHRQQTISLPGLADADATANSPRREPWVIPLES